MKRYSRMILISIAATAWMASVAVAASVSGKPQIPLQVKIAPASPSVKQKTIKPGDAVELKVTAVSPAKGAEMHIEIELLDGAGLVSGDLSWKGILAKREKKQITLSVRAPQSGLGKVRARVFAVRDGQQSAVREATYLLGTDPAAAGTLNMKPAGKDSKGRAVNEYR